MLDLQEVAYAILEPDGELSVHKHPPADSVQRLELPLPVIMEGRVCVPNLEALGLTELWLQAELQRLGMLQHDVFLAMATASRRLHLSPNRMRQQPDRLDH